jgi:signal transduction histidine kinase/CRP-like cAMP-binding protein
MSASVRPGPVAVLASLAIFEGISRANLSRIATQMRRRRFSKGATIYRQGDPAREFFVLTSGRVAVTVEGGDPEVPPVAVIDAPHWFGELAVLTEPTRFVTITASTDSEAWVLSRDRFEACVARHPVIYRNLIASLSKQIQKKDREFVDQSSLAIERARLLDDVQQRNAELAALTEVTRAVSEPLDLDRSLETISTHAAQVTRSDAACIFLYDQDRNAFSLRASYNTAEEYIREVGERPMPPDGVTSPDSPFSRSLVVRSATGRVPVQIADVAATSDYPSRDLLLRSGYRSVLVVPLLHGERVIGSMSVLRSRPREFSAREVELVTTFASHSAIALDHARLFQEVEARNRELVEALEQQTVTGEFLKVISRSTFDLQPVLESLVQSATRLCDADSGFIFRRDGEAYRVAADHGPPDDLRTLVRQHPIQSGRGTLVGRIALERRAVHIPDVLADPEYRWAEAQRAGGYRTALGIPLLREGIPIGVMVLSRNAVRPFTEKQIQLLTTFADQAGIALENVRLFTALQARTQELARSVEGLQALGQTIQAVSSSLELGQVLSTIAEQATKLCDADAGLITEYVEATGEFRPSAGWNTSQELIQAIQAAPPTWGRGATGKSAATGQPVQIPDILAEAGYPFREILVREGYRAVLSIPMIRDGRTLGTLAVARKVPGPFTERHVKLLSTFADQTIMASEHARLFQQLQEKAEQLEVASRHKSHFLASMSHELRTPLNAILGYTELILDSIYGPVPAEIRDVLKRLEKSGRHLLSLINDVLDLSKIEAGQLTLGLTDYSMPEIVRTVFTAVESLAAEKNLALKVTVAPELPLGHGDERRLTQVLLNLLGNAIKFTEVGEVRVEVSTADGAFRVAVSDTGPGIAPADQEKIFEQFQQVDSSSTQKKGGTGLGLSVAKHIIEMHGGRIWVESSPGKGSTFWFTVPVRVERQRGPHDQTDPGDRGSGGQPAHPARSSHERGV